MDPREEQAHPSDGEQASPSLCTVLHEELHELKWAVLVVVCFLTFGSYYIFDVPGSIGTGPEYSIQSYFLERGKPYTQSMNQMLYSVYSWPNTVLAVFGGLLIDRYLGLRRALLLFTSLIFLGSLLCYAGVRSTSYRTLVAGRILFGLGGESLSVSQSAFVARWFRSGRGTALAFGITISFSRVGSSFNFIFSPKIARKWGTDRAVLSGCAACLVSLASCLVLILADMYAVRIGYMKPEAHDAETPPAELDEDALPLLDDANEVAADPADSGAPAAAVMKFSDIMCLSPTYWLLCAICVGCYTSVFPFIGVAKSFFQVKYGYSADQAATYISFYQLTAAAASPLIGGVVDAVGHHAVWLAAASLLFMLVHVSFTFTMIPAPVLMTGMGCVYSFLVSGLWPYIPRAVEEKMTAFAYGLMTAIQNVGLAAVPIVIGRILDRFTVTGGDDSDSGSASWDSNSSSRSLSASLGYAGFAPHQSPGSVLFHTGSANGSDSFEAESRETAALPSLDGYRWSELLFFCAATASLLASLALIVIERRTQTAGAEAAEVVQVGEEPALPQA